MYSAKKYFQMELLLDEYETFINSLTSSNVNYSQLANLENLSSQFNEAQEKPVKGVCAGKTTKCVKRMCELWCETSQKKIDFSIKSCLWNELNDTFFNFIQTIYSQHDA